MNDRVEKKQIQTIKLLKQIGLKMLIIDEIQHILAGNTEKQRHFLNVIKHLGNELMVPIVAVGIKDAFRAIHNDPQLANRFVPYLLPTWKMNTEFLQLLASFEKVLPLKAPSSLIQPEIANKILSMSEGTIGEIATLLSLAAENAIHSGTEKITAKVLENINWVSPSERRRAAERLA